MNSPKIIFTSDLHGRENFYEELFQAAQNYNLPGAWGLDEAVAFQREFAFSGQSSLKFCCKVFGLMLN